MRLAPTEDIVWTLGFCGCAQRNPNEDTKKRQGKNKSHLVLFGRVPAVHQFIKYFLFVVDCTVGADIFFNHHLDHMAGG